MNKVERGRGRRENLPDVEAFDGKCSRKIRNRQMSGPGEQRQTVHQAQVVQRETAVGEAGQRRHIGSGYLQRRSERAQMIGQFRRRIGAAHGCEAELVIRRHGRIQKQLRIQRDRLDSIGAPMRRSVDIPEERGGLHHREPGCIENLTESKQR